MVDLCQEGRSLRSAPQRRHMAHLRWCPLRHPGNPEAGPGRWLKCTVCLGQGTHQAPGHLSSLDLGRAQNARPAESVPLRGAWEPNLSGLDLGSAEMQGSLWTVLLHSALEPEQCRPAKHTPRTGATSVVCTLGARPIHANDICLQCPPPPPTTQLNKWAWISDHLSPLVSGQKLDPEETCKQRKPK